MSLVSCSDSGYDSDEWEYVEEDEDEDGEDEGEWEYYIETCPLEIPSRDLQHPNCSNIIEWKTTSKTESVARTLKNWIKIIKDKNSEILMCLEEEFKGSLHLGDMTSSDKVLKPSIKQYVGKKNKQGKFHGEGEVRYTNGSILWANFKNGSIDGRGTIEQVCSTTTNHETSDFCHQSCLVEWGEDGG